MALLNGDILWHLFWVVPFFFLLFAFAWKKRQRLLALYLGKRSSDPEFVTLSPAARFWRMLLLFTVLISLFIAGARPFWGNSLMPYTGEGRDLLIVFDVSKSMLAKDVQPSRMEHAKFLVRELVKRNPHDRFGLIAFAGKAFLECPMTVDKTSFLQNLDDLDTSTIPVGGTNIEEALKTALAAFKGAESTHLAVILITDGDELTGESSRVLTEAIQRKIPLFIAGIGDPSQPAIIQYKDEKGDLKTLRDAKGNAVNSQLNEKSLALLAARTGGIYVRSSTTSTGLAQLEKRIKALDRSAGKSGKRYRPIERPVYPLSIALFAFFLFLLIPEKRRNKVQKTLLLLFLFSMTFSSEILSAQEANKSKPSSVLPASALPLPAQTLSAPEKEFTLPQSNDPYLLYNTAYKAHFEEKDLPKAEKLYQLALNAASDKEDVRSGACLNLGTLKHHSMRQDMAQSKNLLQQQSLEKALEKVKEAIQKTEAVQELYKYGLMGATARKAAVNQQLLLNEKRQAEELKKKIEELLKQQQQAQENTRKAADQQKKQQQEKEEKKKAEQKKSAQNQTSQAQKSAQQMEKQAQALGQKQMAQQAQKAQKELQQAMDAMKKGQEKKAEKHLEEALKALGADKQDKQNKQNKEDNKDNKNNRDNKDNKNNKEEKDPGKDQEKNQQKDQKNQPPEGRKPEQQEEKGDFDKKQAERLLDLMVKEEKDLKDALKKRMLQLQGPGKVEKDW